MRDDLSDHFGVARRREWHAGLREALAEVAGVDAVSVVTYRELAKPVGAHDHGLGVLDARAAGRGVPRVADRRAASEHAEIGLAEHLADQAHAADDPHVAAIRRRDPRRLLTAVLQRVEREERETPGLLRVGTLGIPDTHDAAHLGISPECVAETPRVHLGQSD